MDEQQAVAEEEQTPSSSKRRRHGERRYRFGPRKQRKRPQLPWWREALLVLLLATAVLFIINPFDKLAQAQATVARPKEPLAVTPPATSESGYCVIGDFQGWQGSDTPLFDNGTSGDRTAGDNIHSRTVQFAEPGRYWWRVLPCGDWDTAVPEKAAWVFVTQPNQPITFTFNPALAPNNLWPRTYALTANDTLPARVVAVGTFQNNRWDNEDPLTEMDPIRNGQFQLAYRVPLPGTYETYMSVQGRGEGIGASGRSREPVPLEFKTSFPAEMVVFQYDGRTDRIAVLYGMPWWLSWLGFGWGARIIAAVTTVGALVLGFQIAYSRTVLRPQWQLSAGCPNCEQHNLRRIGRETADYLLDTVGIPVRRYECLNCGWEGRRIYRHHHRRSNNL
ncbi:choice-of-anchor X domain-containing protein [Candidatus Leptofilum sp.]|uniref:choice-of-anchor X domain-containing protein n=1 Tax=Candidatus Leptofilum sp. TaxID=3241576 RepID=UPI003B5BED12